MSKKTISNILMGIIIVLCISICFLIVCIVRRPRYIETSENESAAIAEGAGDASSDSAMMPRGNVPGAADSGLQAGADESAVAESSISAVPQGKTSTRVNVRNAPTENGKVLDTVEADTTFDIVEVLDTGWTHVIYNGEDAYISSAYVIIIENKND